MVITSPHSSQFSGWLVIKRDCNLSEVLCNLRPLFQLHLLDQFYQVTWNSAVKPLCLHYKYPADNTLILNK